MAGLVVLDHHEKARLQLEGLPYCVFDVEVSGAQLAWVYCAGEEEYRRADWEASWVVAHVADRDLWRFEYGDTRAIMAALAMGLRSWQDCAPSTQVGAWITACKFPNRLLRIGAAILEYQGMLIQSCARRCWEGTIGGMRVLMASSPPELVSEVGAKLLADHPEHEIAALHYVDKGRRMWSLRAREGGADVNALAMRFGGGGHKAAAGMTDPAGEQSWEVGL